jgi:hypothetical protein
MEIRIRTEQQDGKDLWLSEVSFIVASSADPSDYIYTALDEWHGYTTTGEIFKGVDYRSKCEELQSELEDAVRCSMNNDNTHIAYEESWKEHCAYLGEMIERYERRIKNLNEMLKLKKKEVVGGES